MKWLRHRACILALVLEAMCLLGVAGRRSLSPGDTLPQPERRPAPGAGAVLATESVLSADSSQEELALRDGSVSAAGSQGMHARISRKVHPGRNTSSGGSATNGREGSPDGSEVKGERRIFPLRGGAVGNESAQKRFAGVSKNPFGKVTFDVDAASDPGYVPVSTGVTLDSFDKQTQIAPTKAAFLGSTVIVSERKLRKNSSRKGIPKVAGVVMGVLRHELEDADDIIPVFHEESEEAETRSPKLDVEVVQITTKRSSSVQQDPDTEQALPDDVLITTLEPPVMPTSISPNASNSTTNDTQVGEMPRPIVPKCCPMGQRILAEKKKCVESPLEFIPPFLEFENELPSGLLVNAAGEGDGDAGAGEYYEEDGETITTEAEGYDIIVGNPCLYGRYRLEPSVDSRDEFYLLPNGSLIAPFLFDAPLGPDGFCMDVFPDTSAGDVVVLPLVCFPPQTEGQRRSGLQFILYPIGLLLSVPFLLATLVLYAMTPSLRDVHGKALICHVACLTVAYTSLATVQLWGSTLTRSLCFTIACFVQFSFVACFLWLNVMCINTWWNVSLRPAAKWCRRTERRRFVLYSMYAWSLPCILMGVTLVMDLTPTIPSSYLKPRFGIDNCWFQTDRAAIPYFYGPVTVLIVFNTVLFLLTVASQHRRSRRRNKESSSLPLTGSGDTCYRRHPVAAFRSCFLLFGAMGVNWIMEVVSFYTGGPYYIWYVTDIMNCLQGLTIFGIFVLNRAARREIRARLVELRSRRNQDSVKEAPQIDDFRTSRVVQRDSRVYQWQPVPTNIEQTNSRKK